MAKKVLVIDDDTNVTRFVSVALEENGYEAVIAQDGVEGYDKISAEKPDLVILDVMMPKRTGFVLWTKRLEKARFAWPKRSDALVTLTGEQLNLLLDGYDVWRFQPHETLRYASMY